MLQKVSPPLPGGGGRSLPSSVPPRRRGLTVAIALTCGALLAACNTASNLGLEGPAPIAVAAPPVPVDVATLPGNWGLASYHEEKDKDRTITAAKAACSNPYKIGKGPNGGVIMHLADQAQPTELFVKTSSDGRTFIGPRGAPGVIQDRVVMFYQNGVLITEWLDKSARDRYGTMVLVKCA